MYAQQPEIESFLAVGNLAAAYRVSRGFKPGEIPEPEVDDTHILNLFHWLQTPFLQGSAAQIVDWVNLANGGDIYSRLELMDRLVMVSGVVRNQHAAQDEYDRDRLSKK